MRGSLETAATTPLSIGQCAALACLLEVTAIKPGNVHRGADFEDVTYFDFVVSALVIEPAMQAAAEGQSLGRTVYAAVEATRHAVRTNTNLGTILLLAPLAQVPRDITLKTGVADVLARLTAEDSRLVYAAIRLAQPGGLGHMAEHDVSNDAPADLLTAMRAAGARDLVARQYAENFAQVLDLLVPWLHDALRQRWSLNDAITYVYVRTLSQLPDSLIARKCGPHIAQQATERAAAAMCAGRPGDEDYERALADLDFWLRSDYHKRNPGATADLIAASLFAALRDGIIEAPYKLSPSPTGREV